MCGTREVLAEDCTFTMRERQDDTRKAPHPVNRLLGQIEKAQYLSRLAKTRLDCLHAMLQAPRQPWVAFVVRDLRILKQAVPHASDCQASDSLHYGTLPKSFTTRWKDIIKLFCDTRMDAEVLARGGCAASLDKL